MNFRRPLLLLLAATACLAACGKSGQGTAGKPGRGIIAVSLLSLQNPFFKVIGDKITEEATRNGFTTLVVSADNDPVRQSNQVKDFIVKRASAIVLSPKDSKAIIPVI